MEWWVLPVGEPLKLKGTKILLALENFITADFVNCQDEFCLVKLANKKGWIEKKDLWGTE